MDFFKFADELKYGEVHFKSNHEIGLHAMIAIHNLKLGPAIGGTRFIEYETTDDAVFDCMRLARGMTYKAAISRLPHGGGKAVIIRPKGMSDQQRAEIFEAFGEFVDSLDGRYITCEDSGTNISDMDIIKKKTEHVLGFDPHAGSSGDPSPLTAFGVRRGIEAAVKHKLKRDSLEGIHIALQGVGHVGYYLARELHNLGAKLTVADVNPDAAQRCVDEFGATSVDTSKILSTKCDVLAPCALGAILNDKTIPALNTPIVAGAANNQLLEPKHGAQLHKKGILYAPDYAINAGGLINVAVEFEGYNEARVRELVDKIYHTLDEIFARAEKENKQPEVIADTIVDEMLYD